MGFGTVRVSHNTVAAVAAASSFVFLLCSMEKSVLDLTDWCVQRPSDHCAGSGPETAASACSSSLVLWIGAFLSHL